MSTPGALIDALVLAAVRRLAAQPGDRVPLADLRAEFGALSEDAATIALLDAEQHGVIELVSSGESPEPDAAWWTQRGVRGCLCWAREVLPS